VPIPALKEHIATVTGVLSNQQRLICRGKLTEKDVVSSVATVLSDLCSPDEWMPMEKLHAEVKSVQNCIINTKRPHKSRFITFDIPIV
ncbi:FHA domain-containing protein FHA2, partial [Tanacetum coccineum]